jgi:hypothetical protein
MQTGVEIHLHQGKPEHVPRTRTVSARRPQWLITHGPAFRTPVRTKTKLHLGTDSSSSECTTRLAQTSDDSSKRAQKRPARWHRLGTVLQASGIAPRRTEEEQAEAFFPLVGARDDDGGGSKCDARAGQKKTAL